MEPEGWQPEIDTYSRLARGQFACPHCGVSATFKVVANVAAEAAVNRCDAKGCEKLTYLRSEPGWHFDKLSDYWPDPAVLAPHESVPTDIAADWIEAQTVFGSGCNNAAALMCRRVLYGVLLHQGCKEKPMHEGLTELSQKASLPPLMRKKLDEIKEDGHDAAHPSRSLCVDPVDIAETIEFTRDLLRYVYEEPWAMERRYARKALPKSAGATH